MLAVGLAGWPSMSPVWCWPVGIGGCKWTRNGDRPHLLMGLGNTACLMPPAWQDRLANLRLSMCVPPCGLGEIRAEGVKPGALNMSLN